MTSGTLPACDVSLNLLTLHAPKAGDFLELILLYLNLFICIFIYFFTLSVTL